ncbi:MAG: UDP-N-acetylmuramoyl-L-alanyl-D-glutamate--2,6-diaminopimelate ligase [Piscinibacter sp.]|uniref:UDP-N-acetylmuramoyl-L-alanyl-D-glutamate--2, 6-diaminopimelate ligase n=1 Tax=Piscinibacter sp. TaxID=1903157 RepID=UPI001B4BC9DD|nr:UDP-N-acetylmuramoyl-L-alanyl-D-glutamate--2,6-diaminopimelate ligase [Piscinibacter sp.]MBP5991971.1 UDP-N-acetylmuramoyl-L-alanyl-D-glutamate--2,6-diaminopimelate ligase [Piscinibacter sp.]MBP6029425.1 UDP-N-acetylmuramoyl-L-alanyl-D-glutamate--2,6-diaminopimelate ligase [Piscinibacter sp.]
MAGLHALQQLADARAACEWLAHRGVRGLATDSRRVQPGDAFIAWPGYALDGRQYVKAALAAGASACLVEAEGASGFDFGADAPVAALTGLKARTGEIADEFYGRPSESLAVVATTGTNGKTSTAWWTAQALRQLGKRCGVIGTLGVGEPPQGLQFTGLTTPDPVTVQQSLRRFADQGFAACAIEASSIGVVEQRLAGTRFAVALFTNFTQDHLDYHGSMAAYWDAKRVLFDWPGLRAAVINLDDPKGEELAAQLRGPEAWTYSLRRDARLRAERIAYADGGLGFEVVEGAARAPVRSALIGEYNVSNLLAVIGGLRALGVPLAEAAAACAVLSSVPGRMQRVEASRAGPEVVVDYAHSPDALEKALIALRPFATQRGGRLWAVFGCGGNRDTAKRPLMGAIAQRLADRVVLTSDNPRHEAPAAILAQIRAGLSGDAQAVKVIEDRRAAIVASVREAAPADVILLAGKGHEDYQEIAGVKQPFSDVAEARLALEVRA